MTSGLGAGVGLLLLFGGIARADSCAAVSPAEKVRVAQYVVRKYHVPQEANLRVEADETVGTLCYHKLVFRGDGALGAYRLTLYATPDLRFLSTDLLDSFADPEREEREAASRTMGRLLEGEYASRGPATAPVTLVVFSDFQCPFCKRMQSLLAAEPLLQPGGNVRLVFRHMPMSQHDWAQKAAEAAACAQFQIGGFKSCMDRQMSLGAVIRDKDLGSRLGVKGTPTLFINGEQAPAIQSAADLHRLLGDALTNTTARAGGGGTPGSQ